MRHPAFGVMRPEELLFILANTARRGIHEPSVANSMRKLKQSDLPTLRTVGRWFQPSDSAPCEFRDPARAVPIGNENVPIGIDEAAVCRAEQVRLDVVRIEFVIRPLCRLRIIT
jgi:hypothetical protein